MAASVRIERRSGSTAPAASTSVCPSTWMRTSAVRRAAVIIGGMGGSGIGGRVPSSVTWVGPKRCASPRTSLSVARVARTAMPSWSMRAVPEASTSMVQRARPSPPARTTA